MKETAWCDRVSSESLIWLLCLCCPRPTAVPWPTTGLNSEVPTQQVSLPILIYPPTWNETENLRWKVELPGPGSSSPIIHGDRVYVTSYSGYGLPGDTEGDVKSLMRQLTCVDRITGTLLWTSTVPGTVPEDLFQGYISEHGYASNTPVTDGERVFCFFGKSGVVAFDRQGKQLWQTPVGSESSIRRWGSGASLILYKNLVIVNAAEESQALRALDQLDGKEVWKVENPALELAYATPGLVQRNEGRTDLVMALPGEAWGLNPETGETRWTIEHELTGTICPSILAHEDTIFIFGGFRSAGSLALKLRDKEAAAPEVLWDQPQQFLRRNSGPVERPPLLDR